MRSVSIDIIGISGKNQGFSVRKRRFQDLKPPSLREDFRETH